MWTGFLMDLHCPAANWTDKVVSDKGFKHPGCNYGNIKRYFQTPAWHFSKLHCT